MKQDKQKQHETTYIYKFFKAKRIDVNTTRMAHVKVYTIKGKEIGSEVVYRGETPENAVDRLVRDYELRKIWNSKQFSFNQ